MGDKPIKPGFKKFPFRKRLPGERGNVDVDIEKIKEMYVSGAHYSWVGFCKANGYNPQSNNHDWFKKLVDMDEWKREWVKRKNLNLEDEITPDLFDCRKMIAIGRIKFVHEWTAISKNMKALLTHLMNQHVMAAAEDQKNAFTIQSGLTKKKCTLTIDELDEFASAANRIAELEARACLVVVGDKNDARRQMEELKEENKDSIPEFEVHTIGTTMSAAERTRMLAEYFDQFEKPKEPLPALEVKPEPEDQG